MKLQKLHIRIPLPKKARYVTLLGDRVGRHPVLSFILSSEFASSALVGASIPFALGSSDPVLSSIEWALGLGIPNALGILFSRHAEKLVNAPVNANDLLSDEMMEQLCIDKNPTPERSRESVARYASSFERVERRYSDHAIFTAPLAGWFGVVALGPGIRTIKGLARARNIITGKWAVMSRGDEAQEKIGNVLEFDVYVPAEQPA